MSSILTDSTIPPHVRPMPRIVIPRYDARPLAALAVAAAGRGERSAMSLLSQHFDVDRRAAFRARRHEPVHFDKAMRCWVVFDPAQVLHLLRHPGLACEEISGSIAAVEERYGERFPNIGFLVRNMPLMNEGPAHAQMRRRMAALVADRRASMQAALPDLVGRHLSCLGKPGNTDLVADVFLPFVRDWFTVLVGSTESVPFEQVSITRIFDRYLGLGTIRRIEAAIAALRSVVARGCSDAVARGDEDMIVCLFVLGRDSLLATLAESMAATLAAHPGSRLSEIRYPDHPNETGVAIAERIATEPIPAGEVAIAPGDRVRLYLQSLNYADRPAVQRLVFGAGAHACLGRQLTLDLWPTITASFAASPLRIAAVDRAYVNNHIFVMPAHLRIELRA